MKFLILNISILTLVFLIGCNPENAEVEEIEPKLSFSISKERLTVGEILSIENRSEGFEDLVWNFGDGTISDENVLQHAFEYIGDFKIELTGRNSLTGAEVTVAKQVQVDYEIATSTIPIADIPIGRNVNFSSIIAISRNEALIFYNDTSSIRRTLRNLKAIKIRSFLGILTKSSPVLVKHKGWLPITIGSTYDENFVFSHSSRITSGKIDLSSFEEVSLFSELGSIANSVILRSQDDTFYLAGGIGSDDQLEFRLFELSDDFQVIGALDRALSSGFLVSKTVLFNSSFSTY